jgi:hypothetical protein
LAGQLASVARRHEASEASPAARDRRQRRRELVRATASRSAARSSPLRRAASAAVAASRSACPLEADRGRWDHRLEHRVVHRATLHREAADPRPAESWVAVTTRPAEARAT